MTSANTVNYEIYRNGKHVGRHSIHFMCKISYDRLLTFTPIEEHTILEYWYDEEEEYHSKKIVPLKTFLINNKTIKS
jgi:hypothetical protein